MHLHTSNANPSMTGDCCVFKFLRRSVDGKKFERRFERETTVFHNSSSVAWTEPGHVHTTQEKFENVTITCTGNFLKLCLTKTLAEKSNDFRSTLTSAEELVTTSKNNLRGIFLNIESSCTANY